MQAARVIALIQGILWALFGLLFLLSTLSRVVAVGELHSGETAYLLGYSIAAIGIPAFMIGIAVVTFVLVSRMTFGRGRVRTGLIALEGVEIGLAVLLVAIGVLVALTSSLHDDRVAGVVMAVVFFLISAIPATIVLLLTRPAAKAYFTSGAAG